MAYLNPDDQRRYAAEHYARNKAAYKRRGKAHKERQRIRLRALVDEAKAIPCVDCAQTYPPHVMQFDHVSDDKDANVADMVQRGLAVKRVQAEIAKCEVVCANCHAERTHVRRTLTRRAEPEVDDRQLRLVG